MSGTVLIGAGTRKVVFSFDYYSFFSHGERSESTDGLSNVSVSPFCLDRFFKYKRQLKD
jgi:hypothetical protein